ncbi:MAG: replication-associated recombination protein A [Candidatus Gracilibacteria bacterium]
MEPLAFRMRPKSLDDVIGQKHLLVKGNLLYDAVSQDRLFSFLLWGPPGTGKTSLASAIAHQTKSKFVRVNAVSSGVKDLREIVKEAQMEMTTLFQKRTILFIDEIHRFNKSQQDFLLPFVEHGVLTLIGATTENPSFEVNAALLSRMRVFVLKDLTEEALVGILKKALEKDSEAKKYAEKITDEDLAFIAKISFGDARSALNTLEQLFPYAEELSESNKTGIEREEVLAELLKSKVLRYDKNGEEHYNIISALHKSMRDSDIDASIYWVVRMMEAGEDPKYIVRRMIRFATEDIGLADPQALVQAIAVKENITFVGMPESGTALVQLAAYLAKAPKSNACYTAYSKAKEIIERTGPLGVPLHIRNGSTKLMKNLGYGKGYKYAHDFKEAKVEQEHFPEELKGTRLWEE